MNYWWLNQRAKFALSNVIKGGRYLWAPRLTEKGKNIWHWDFIKEVNNGDIIFAYRHNRIHAVAIAHGTAYHAERPAKLGYKKIWENKGYRLDVEFLKLGDKALELSKIYNSIKPLLPKKYSPVDINGHATESYLHPISQELGEYLSREVNFSPRVTKEDYVKSFTTNAPKGPLDKTAARAARMEQGYLRQELFKKDKYSMKDSEVCAICGKEYPINLLVAAHIKKRAKCSDEEKRDYENIVMPLCKLGCDELYERGYIAVIKGKVFIINQNKITSDLKRYLVKIDGLSCSQWKPSTKKYFRDHYNTCLNN